MVSYYECTIAFYAAVLLFTNYPIVDLLTPRILAASLVLAKADNCVIIHTIIEMITIGYNRSNGGGGGIHKLNKAVPRMGVIQKMADYFGLQKSDIIEPSGTAAIQLPNGKKTKKPSGGGGNFFRGEFRK